jgi:acetyltransferase-like isoleucine patch superfamily enzyme
MSHIVKNIIVLVLQPWAALRNHLTAAGRLWAHARLKQALGGQLESSVLVMNMPELHGSKNISLGRNLYLVAFNAVVLESGVMIGEYTSVRDANHRIVAQGSMRHSGHRGQAILIKKNAWIGRGVTILAGVTIGENAVIGANAVVTHDIPDGAVAVGVPARTLD